MFNSRGHFLIFLATAQLFLSLSLLFGTWVIYIPSITEKLHMSEGQLGISLLFGAVGSLIGTIIGKYITPKSGEGQIAQISIIIVALSTISLFISTSYYQLSMALFLFGVSSGVFQVAVNTLVVTIEKKYTITIMSTCHAFFSLGAMIAAGLGSILMLKILNPLTHIIISIIIVVLFQALAAKLIFRIKEPPLASVKKTKIDKAKLALLFWIALIGISGMVSEGAIADWSGLYLKNIAKAKDAYLGLGYAGFSMAMTIGRFSGDYFSKRFGSLPLILAGFSISIIGFILVLLAQPMPALVGFIIIGLGLSIIVPEAYRLSANIDGVSPSTGIAFIAGAAYIGFLAGPVLLGFIAEQFNLHISFMSLTGLIIFGGLLSFTLNSNSRFKLKLSTKKAQ